MLKNQISILPSVTPVALSQPRLLQDGPALGVPSAGMARISTLVSLLAPAQLHRGSKACRQESLDALLAWGNKPSAQAAERLARQRQLPLWRCEDGFLRSLGLGADGPPLSLVVDDLGIYYDATRPSRLEALIAAPIDANARQRAQQLQRLWCQERLSKYNGARESVPPREPFVLVVDQTAGDQSIRSGLADAESFLTMLEAARRDHPHCRIVLKIHPDVVRGRKRGHYHAALRQDPGLVLCADGGHPAALLQQARAVYVVTSQLGFEALLWNKPVYCFGMPFYAGWGLTRDALPAPARRLHGSDLERLIHAALIDYPAYFDPHHQSRCTPERLMRLLGLQQRRQREFPDRLEAFGFKPWKQPILRRFLSGSQVRFRRRQSRPSRRAEALAIWGRDAGQGVNQQRHQQELRPLLRVEDGFVRSVGLGANLITPLSWVIDRRGIYYDAGSTSDLELYLAEHVFTEAERRRGEALRRQLINGAITKYNLAAPPWRRPDHAARVVLVPGQVESDASIRYGTGGLRTNRQLLEAVRAAEPEAWLIYKPHPDVVAGLRPGNSRGFDPDGFSDEVVIHAAIGQLYEAVDTVHVLTSLAGFEALLRQRDVHTWGMPFYAGWGLSQDRMHCERRGRQLQLDELVYASLIAYPRYMSRRSGLFIEPEEAIDELCHWRQESATRLQWWQLVFRHWGRARERFGDHTR
ncbi:MAG: capsular polysaccharide biosynthesis protein [Cyanobium sp.]